MLKKIFTCCLTKEKEEEDLEILETWKNKKFVEAKSPEGKKDTSIRYFNSEIR